jgi:hypothetical protein
LLFLFYCSIGIFFFVMTIKVIMYKKFSFLLLILISQACNKNKETPGCPLQVCTDIFASIGVTFEDNQGRPIAIENLQVKNLRTHLNLTRGVNNVLWVIGYYIIADDSDLKQLSTDGDNIQVSATNPITKQTINTIFKIAGGCNCHVIKISGPDKIVFN